MNEQFNITGSTTDVVIFVHGFGVRWDSRGMFTEIAASLPKEFGTVFFDFNQVEDTSILVRPLTEQVSRLEEAFKKIESKWPTVRIHIIAHSMGCVVTALSNIDPDGAVIFLAPTERFDDRIKNYFMNQPGAHERLGELVIPRKDSTTTYIPATFFDNLKNIQAEMQIGAFSRTHFTHILHATADEVLGRVQYKQLQPLDTVKITALEADHNFTNQRPELTRCIRDILKV